MDAQEAGLIQPIYLFDKATTLTFPVAKFGSYVVAFERERPMG